MNILFAAIYFQKLNKLKYKNYYERCILCRNSAKTEVKQSFDSSPKDSFTIIWQ